MIGVTTLPQRLGEVGRIRLGDEKIDSRRPGAPLDRFRITVAEHDGSILEDVVAVYGGEVKPWKDNDGSPAWQAILAAESIDVAIPPDDSALSIWYEQWRGGYCVVRCNAARCQRPVGKGAAAHWEEGPCRCDPTTGGEVCELVTRLNVVLLGVPAYGLFRLDTGSVHAARTFPAVVAMAQQLAHDGRPVPATLSIQAKTTKNLGRATPKQNFRIPVLRLAVGLTRDTLLTGPTQIPQIAAPVESVPTPEKQIPPDDDAIDVEATVTQDSAAPAECASEALPSGQGTEDTVQPGDDAAEPNSPAAASPPAGAPWLDMPHAELLKDQPAYKAFLVALQKEGGSLGAYQRSVGGSIADHTARRILAWASGGEEQA